MDFFGTSEKLSFDSLEFGLVLPERVETGQQKKGDSFFILETIDEVYE